jgi:hypothetical protein
MVSETNESSTVEQSEFGAGVIVCLAKFSGHLENDWYRRCRNAERWRTMSEDARKTIAAESKTHPYGDSARIVADVIVGFDRDDCGLSHSIELWMNAASDHFYDLDRERAPQPLRDLAGLTLKIGHGFTGEKWTWQTVEEIERLWRESCLAIDAQIGTKADWGQW